MKNWNSFGVLFPILAAIVLYLLNLPEGKSDICAVYTSTILIMYFITSMFNNNMPRT